MLKARDAKEQITIFPRLQAWSKPYLTITDVKKLTKGTNGTAADTGGSQTTVPFHVATGGNPDCEGEPQCN